VQLKLDAEFPRFTQALLEMVYPHYLAPTRRCSCAVQNRIHRPQSRGGPVVARGSALHGLLTETRSPPASSARPTT